MANYMVVGEDHFAEKVAQALQVDYIQLTSTIFPDQEVKTRMNPPSFKNIDGKTALLVIRSNRYEPNPNDCVLKTLLISDTLTRYGVKRQALLFPYMFYARQDGERLLGESNSLAKIANIYENLGFEHLITVNSHLYGNQTNLQSFFKTIKVHDVSIARLFASYLMTKDLENPFIISPGVGPEKMAMELSHLLNCKYECIPKVRNPETGRVDMESPTSNLGDKDVIIYDDIASSGGTTEMAFRLSENNSPKTLFIALAHLWTAQGIKRLSVLGSQELITTDSFSTEYTESPFTELSIIPLLVETLTKNL